MHIHTRFEREEMPEGFYWLNEPASFKLGNGLELLTRKETDFWQNTHYGFRRDDGHCLLCHQTGDFSLTAHTKFRPQTRFDQCGLMVRLDQDNWIKMSCEYEDASCSRLGSVVTNLGFSDWATQDITSDRHDMWYRIRKNGQDFLLEHSQDGSHWLQQRIAHLHRQASACQIGLYACSPIGEHFCCQFDALEIGENTWL